MVKLRGEGHFVEDVVGLLGIHDHLLGEDFNGHNFFFELAAFLALLASHFLLVRPLGGQTGGALLTRDQSLL